ncbi:protein of unknown function [Paraburkholderia dioscoreae]|uniref:Uncharacterized protein n=1 Tax=Paraburkholderia dioscoreae TaxID=2604047 RepID=A0A5Q4ZP93_9BURK|nr:protein of unknown function [Paraburkholderia dioscoreae]
MTTPTSGVCGGGADCFGPHAASNTAAVAALIKRNGTRSTRMERPLSKTERMKKCEHPYAGDSSARMRLATPDRMPVDANRTCRAS